MSAQLPFHAALLDNEPSTIAEPLNMISTERYATCEATVVLDGSLHPACHESLSDGLQGVANLISYSPVLSKQQNISAIGFETPSNEDIRLERLNVAHQPEDGTTTGTITESPLLERDTEYTENSIFESVGSFECFLGSNATDFSFGSITQDGPARSPSPPKHQKYQEMATLEPVADLKTHEESSELARHTTAIGNVSVEARVEYIMERVQAMGFDSFDALVTTYYSRPLTNMSLFSNAQRMSRNRRLPGVIASVSQSAAGWTNWERRGLDEELVKATEAILASENIAGHADVCTGATRIVERSGNLGSESSAIAVSDLKESLPDKVRNPELHPRAE